MKKSIKCNFGDVIFYINTFKQYDYNKQLAHIKEFYIPCKVPKKEVKMVNINYSTDKYMFDKYLEECRRRKGKLYQSFENQVHKEIEVANNSKKVYLIDNEEYICIKDDECNYTILSDGREQGIKWPFRILRELLVREREDEGNLFMHGTGVSLNERGILFLGNSGSGKTTLAIKMISEDIYRRGFISNDRVFIKNGKNVLSLIKNLAFEIALKYGVVPISSNFIFVMFFPFKNFLILFLSCLLTDKFNL